VFAIAPVDEAQVASLVRALRVRPVTARCMAVRGVGVAEAGAFLEPRLGCLRRPEGLAGFDAAVVEIARAVVAGDRIGVFGDYDVDGVTSTAVLTEFLRAAGGDVVAAVARRDAGYGFTREAAADFAARGCRTIVTGDCGTSDVDAIAVARSLGLGVIVIDHHTVPSAAHAHPSLALVNPHRADSTFPFRGMCSVGLAFYVACAVRTRLREEGWFRSRREPDPRDLLDLVALGTIADLVPLRGENRILTKLGLARLDARARPGIAALLAGAGVEPGAAVDVRTVAWKLAPRLNAPGRMGAALPALQLLLAGEGEAEACAAALEGANQDRRAAQDKVLAEALAVVEREASRQRDDGPIVFAAGRGWAPGVVGVVAARLVEKFARPAFVVALDDDGIGRGSARSSGGVDLYRALAAAAPFLDRFGGHAAAAGMTVRAAELDRVKEALAAAVRDQVAELAQGSGPHATARLADAAVSIAEVDERLASELERLAPFGQDNRPPALVARDVPVVSARRVGDGSHLKLELDDGRGGVRGAIGFGLGDAAVEAGARVGIRFAPSLSTWQGRTRVELELSHLEVHPPA
jgi:single-stranded-DNA-specific exonuclease